MSAGESKSPSITLTKSPFTIGSKLPKDTRITVQYKESICQDPTETNTYELFVVKDIVKVTQPYKFSTYTMYGYHETIVDPNLTSGLTFTLKYTIHKDGIIKLIGSRYKRQEWRSIPPILLGYQHGQTISNVHISAIDTWKKKPLWQKDTGFHTGFQPQKIW